MIVGTCGALRAERYRCRSEVAARRAANKLMEHGEALVQRWVLLEMAPDDAVHTLLNHHVDEVLLVRLEDDGEEQQARRLLVRHRARLQQIHLVSAQEVAPRVHQNLRVDRWRVFLKHQGRVEQRDRFEAQWVASAERQEFDVNLRELNVELAEVADVVREEPVDEVALYELVLERVLVRPHQELERVQSYLVFLHVAVHEHHRLDLVVDAVTHELELEDELLTELESEVGLAEQPVEEGIVLLDQLVEDVLEDGSHIGHLEDLEATLVLHFFVRSVVPRRIFHGANPVGVFKWAPKLA